MGWCSTLPITAAGSVSGGEGGTANDPTYSKTLFVGKADNSTESGTLLEPYHTISSALSAASGLTPSSSNEIGIFIFGGEYGESGLSALSYVYLIGIGPDPVILKHANNIFTIGVDETSIANVTFEASSTNSIITIDGTSMTGHARLRNCRFVGAGDDGNVILCQDGGLAKFNDCRVEADNVGDRIIQTDSNSGNDIQFYDSEILGDILHQGGDLDFNKVTANIGVSCTGSSNLDISDSFVRNSVDHVLELGTTGNVYLHNSTLLSPGYVVSTNYHCIDATANPTACEIIGCTLRDDGTASDYSLYSTVSFTFAGHGNNLEEGYNSNVTDNGIATKGTPVNADTVIIQDSADSWKSKKAALNSLPGSGGGNWSSVTIDANKDMLGYDLTNLGIVEVDEQLTIPRDQAGVTAGDVRYNSTDVALEYYDGSGWHDAGSPLLVTASDSSVAEGNNSLTGLRDKYLVKTLEVVTTSPNWTLTVYSSDDYSSDPIVILENRNRNVLFQWDHPYEDKDATAEFHYNFSDNAGTATHSIEVFGTSLR